MIELVPARLAHVGPIATRMRSDDVAECRALGRKPKEALRLGLRFSLAPVAVLIDRRPEAMLGVYPQSLIGSVGVPWMLGTEVLYDNARGFIELGPLVIGQMLADFALLENVVSVENVRAIRFLRWVGFSVTGPVQMHGGVPFVPFRLMRAIQALPVPA